MNPILCTEKVEIQIADSEEKIKKCFPIMRQLRPHLSDEAASSSRSCGR